MALGFIPDRMTVVQIGTNNLLIATSILRMLQGVAVRIQSCFLLSVRGVYAHRKSRMSSFSTKKRKLETKKSERLVWVDLEVNLTCQGK